MDYSSLIAAVLSTFLIYGPGLVKSVTDLIHGNPQRPGETDEEYVARINAMIDAKAADTAAVDAEIENENEALPEPGPGPVTEAETPKPKPPTGSDDQPPH